MARRKTIRHKKKMTIPVAVVAGMLPLLATALSDFQAGGVQGLQNTVTCVVPYSPANRRITFARLHLGLYPMIAGFLIHKFVGSGLGLNRALASAGVPFIRI